ncbi:hypothetical protein AB0N61_10915 [Microbacterium sp. NPDC089320]|uniref:hypothetical protein n=1 Tax=Microbacterium sp. NPDC089320 TaxID=3155182 RepID=UPI00143AC9EF
MTAKIHAAHVRESEVDQASPGTVASAEPSYERVDLDRYVVLHDGPVGYIEHVHPVFVCYVGHPYPKADEVAQVHDFHEAIQTVRDRAVVSGSAQ